MSRKFAFFVAIGLCLALAFAPVLAERGVDRQGNRSKVGVTQRAPSQSVNWIQTFDEEFLNRPRVGNKPIPVNDPGATTGSKAAKLVETASKIGGAEGIALLQQVRAMNLPSTEENDKILARANLLLADLYSGSGTKQVALYAKALQYTTDPGLRSRIEARITELGGDVFALSFSQPQAMSATRAAGDADTCDQATAAQPFASQTMNIMPLGDKNWRFFDVPGGTGWTVRIETVSPVPGSTAWDTNLTLWGGCDAGTGQGTNFIAFNEDSSEANAPYMSRIDSGCLGPGTYYIEVGGFDDAVTVPDFDLEVENTSTCEIALPDAFEPDNDPADNQIRAGRDVTGGTGCISGPCAGMPYSELGWPTAIPENANGWGRSKREIQARNFVPAGDVDFVTVSTLNKPTRVRVGTAAKFGTFFNGFDGSAPSDNPDTFLGIYYNKEYDYGGLCNEPAVGFTLNECLTDQDCIDACNGSFPCNGAPVPGFPPCIPFYFFGLPFDGFPGIGHVNALAYNDDRDGAADRGSELSVCLARGKYPTGDSTWNGDWIVRVEPFNASDTFDYELQVKNVANCTFEVEPNNSFATANPYEIGEVVDGINQSRYIHVGDPNDADLWKFDVEETEHYRFWTNSWTHGFDPVAGGADTYLELWVGPDDGGNFRMIAYQDDIVNGVDQQSDLNEFNFDVPDLGIVADTPLVLPPASELLGNVVNDADYYINQTTYFFNPHFPYTLMSEIVEETPSESEPNDSPSIANTLEVGGKILGSLSACDLDVYKVTLTEDTFLTAKTGGIGDTSIRIKNASELALGCDDDSGPGVLSKATGCLSAGEYYVEVRAFSGFSSFSYDLTLTGQAGCAALNPPDLTGDNGLTCASFDVCP